MQARGWKIQSIERGMEFVFQMMMMISLENLCACKMLSYENKRSKGLRYQSCRGFFFPYSFLGL